MGTIIVGSTALFTFGGLVAVPASTRTDLLARRPWTRWRSPTPGRLLRRTRAPQRASSRCRPATGIWELPIDCGLVTGETALPRSWCLQSEVNLRSHANSSEKCSSSHTSRGEGVGFEPTGLITNGFQDRRIRPLCHPSLCSSSRRCRPADRAWPCTGYASRPRVFRKQPPGLHPYTGGDEPVPNAKAISTAAPHWHRQTSL